MAPAKSLKELRTAPVYSMDHSQQVDLLSQALLREYMHRRGFKKTLEAFDTDCPRTETTISSRALMGDLMTLNAADQQRMKAEGTETIMEMLCNLRVERRLLQEVVLAEESLAIPDLPEDYEKRREAHLRYVEKQAKKKAKKEAGGDERSSHKKSKSSKHSKTEAAEIEGGIVLKRRPALVARTIDFPETDLKTMDDLLGSSSSSNDGDAADKLTTSAEGGKPMPPAFLQSGAPPPPPRSHAAPPIPNASPRPAGAAGVALSTPHNSAAAAGSSSLEDNTEREAYWSSASSLNAQDARAAFGLLVGSSGAHVPNLRALLCQGFVFDESVEYALVQWESGAPDAAIAAVQAFIVAFYHEKVVYNVAVEERQKEYLCRALRSILIKAQPSAQRIILVDGKLSRQVKTQSPTDQYQHVEQRLLSSFCMWSNFSSMDEVDAQLQTLVEGHWSAPKECGMLCFLFSVLLSRGCTQVRLDMKDSTCPLVVPRSKRVAGGGGDGAVSSPELAHLCLDGRATPQLLSSTLPCALLEDNSTNLLKEGGARSISSSTYPSWVLHCNGCYANVFMKRDTRKTFTQKQSFGGASMDLFYWDCSTEQDELPLSVRVGMPAMGSRTSATTEAINRAILSLHEWVGGSVEWKGKPQEGGTRPLHPTSCEARGCGSLPGHLHLQWKEMVMMMMLADTFSIHV